MAKQPAPAPSRGILPEETIFTKIKKALEKK